MDTKTKKRLGKIINVAYICMLAAVAYIGFKYGLPLIMPFIVALCLVALTQPLIRRIERRRKVSHKLFSVLLLALLYITAGTALFLIVNSFIVWCRGALSALPQYYATTIAPTVETITEKINDFLGSSTGSLILNNDGITGWLQSLVSSVSRKGLDLIAGFTMNIPRFLIALLFTVMLSFSISLRYDSVVAFIKRQLPVKAKKMLSDIRNVMVGTILKYLRAFLILMLITFAELTIGLLILRVPNALGLAALIALLDILPVFGTGTVLIPWALVELIEKNYLFAVGLAILYITITIIRNVIEPKIVGSSLGMNAVVSLLSIYLGFKLFGIGGMIFMPIAVQVLLSLHKNGSIRLYREQRSKKSDTAEKVRPDKK